MWVILLFLFNLAWSSTEGVYTVQPGDTLSSIAKDQIGSPVYTPSGSLNFLLKQNPHITNPNLIFVGQEIYISNIDRKILEKPKEIIKKLPIAKNVTQRPINITMEPEVLDIKKVEVEKTEVKEEPKKVSAEVGRENADDNFPIEGHSLRVGVFYNALQAIQISNSAKAYAYSDLSPSLSYSWYLKWPNDYTTSFDIDLQWSKFALDGTQKLKSASAYYSKFAVRLIKDYPQWLWNTSLAAENSFLLKTQSANALEIANTLSSNASLGAAKKIFNTSNAQFLVGGEIYLFIPMKTTSYSFKDGQGAKVFLQQERKDKSVQFYYLQNQNKTSEQKLITQKMGLEFTWNF